MSIVSSILNPIMFKNLTGSYPNWLNTLHANHKHATFRVLHYHQLFPKDEVVYLQFSSDSDTAVTFKAWNGATEITTGITAKAMATIAGDDTRYYFSFSVELGADYYDKDVYFTVVQGTVTLTSEPIYASNIAMELANGEIKKIKYTNLDRNYSLGLNDAFIYWDDLQSTGSYLQFYVEAQDKDLSDSDEIEILEGSQSKDVISSQLFAGQELKTGLIPDYMVRRLEACSSLDIFTVNDVQFIKEGAIESTIAGNSTSFQSTIKMTQKNVLAINIDDLGITDYNSENMTENQIFTDKSTDFDTEIPAGYMVHTIFAKHAATSTGTAVLIAGLTAGTDTLIDAIQGTFSDAVIHQFPVHYATSLTEVAGRLYIGVGGVGVKLNITVQYLKIV